MKKRYNIHCRDCGRFLCEILAEPGTVLREDLHKDLKGHVGHRIYYEEVGY